MYVYKTKIKLHDTDAAGLIFFANQFKFMHDAYEELIASLGFGFNHLLHKRDFFLPVVHAQADYTSTLFVDDPIAIQITVDHIGTTSFALAYEIFDTNRNILVGRGKTVHVTMHKTSKTKMPLPDDIREKLRKMKDNQ